MLAALAQVGGEEADEYGLAAADISTGRFETLTLRAADLPAALARLRPSEIVLPDGLDLELPDSNPFDRAAFSRSRSAEHTYELQSLMRISYAVFCLQKQNTLSYYQ